MRYARRQQRQAAACTAQVQAFAQVGAIGEQRRRVAVVTHAQHQHIDRGQLGQGLIGLLGRRVKVLGWPIQANETGLGRRALEQMTLEQAGIAVGVLYRHPALVGQAYRDLRPVQRLSRELFEKRYRAAATGQHHTGLALAGNGRAQALGHRLRQGRRQGVGIGQRVRLYGGWQLQFRYRHTTTSHHA
ncbi:hypothetical protein D3C79_776690 [compost metagenome]